MKGAAARRITLASAAIAFLFVVAALVAVSVAAYAQPVRDIGIELARTLPRAYDDARPRFPSPDATLAAVLAGVTTTGWRVRLAAGDALNAPLGPGGPLLPPGGAAPPATGALAALVGIVPKRVPLVDAPLEIVPDLGRLARTAEIEAFAVLVVLAFGVAALWRFADALGRAELEPVVQTTAALRRLAARDFVARTIVTAEHGATGELAQAYNEAAEQVAVAIRERDAAEAEMQRFLADAGHELRTPVTIMMGYLEILRGMTPAGNETGDRVINGMHAEMGRMRTLIEKLIVLSRLESMPVEPASVDVVAVAAGVRESLSALAGDRAIAIDAPAAALVTGDENDLHEALSNLVENALKYAPGSDVRIAVSETADTVRIEVADRGPGMDAVDLRRAFERFYRGAGRTGNEGSGLGLAIVKRAVERCGGSVSATSSPRDGTRFTIAFPR
jgi:two-component system, OmpR family, sensor kinase